MRITYRPLVAMAGVAILAACGGGSSTSSATGAASDTAAASASASASASAPAPSPSGSALPQRGDADLVVWTDQLKAPAVQKAAEKFAADNGIKVAVQVIATDLQANLVTANAAGNGPDVFTGAHDWIGNLVQNGSIEPLQISADKLSGYEDVAVKAETYNGKLYALPYGIEALAFYRNTAISPDAPKTMDDALAAGEAAVKAGTVTSALNLPVGQNGDAYHMQPILTSMGGYMFGRTAAGDYDPKDLGIGKEGSIAAAKKIGELGEKGKNILRRSISGDNNIALFAGGKAAFMISGPWALNDVKKGGVKYAVSPIPGFAGQKPAAPFAGVQGFYVASKAKNMTFAQEFVSNAMNTPEAMTAMYDAASLPPAMKAVQAHAISAEPSVEVFLAGARTGAPMPAIPAMSAVWEPLGKAYSAIVGGADPTATITAAGKTIADAIAKG